jgi:glycosyltransferase involved in cell wall biosynthesis
MISNVIDVAELTAQDAGLQPYPSELDSTVAALSVFMMDLWCYTPYYDRYLCEALAAEGVTVTLGAVSPYQDKDYFAKNGLQNDPGLIDLVPRLGIANDTVRRVLMLAESCINMTALLARFAVVRPDIVHVQWVPTVKKLPFERWFLRLVKRLGIKLVYTVHNVLPHDSGRKFVGTFKRIYEEMDALICHTSDAKERLIREFSIAAERIWVIPHGPLLHDAKRQTAAEAKRQLAVSESEPLILWQGIIRSYKGIDFLLEGWRKVQDAGVKAGLLIAGSGEPELMKEIRQQVERLGLADSVRLDFKYIPDSDLPTYYQAADVLVYPYREVTTSGALMTAVAYGKAIVATNLPAFREALHNGETALLVSYGDVEALSDALARVIRDGKERERLASAVAAASETDNSWNRIAQDTRRCYASVLQDSNLRRSNLRDSNLRGSTLQKSAPGEAAR